MYDVRCPICGTLNKNLYLEDTDGWLECEHCKNVTQIMQHRKAGKKIPVYTPEQLTKQVTQAI